MNRVVLALLSSLALSGCATGSLFAISEADTTAFPQVDAEGGVDIGGLSVMLDPDNDQPQLDMRGMLFPIIPVWCCRDVERSNDDFHVTISFAPQSDDFTVTPERIALHIGDKVYTAKAIGGPFLCDKAKNKRSRCAYEEKQLTAADLQTPVPIKKGHYVVAFPVKTPEPTRRFSIVFDGVHRNGNVLPSSKIDFKQSHTFSFGFGSR